MKVITASDVNDAYSQGVALLLQHGERQESRAGEVLVYHEPVVTRTLHPECRVLLCPERRANPFFHLFESLWMLSGRDDATWLDQFVSDFSDRFAEPDGTQWGAYGYRWRRHFCMIDQLRIVTEKLRRDPLDRRVVIAMWDPEDDLASEERTDTGQPARDLPCNTHIYPRVVGGALDLTVCCRSNDAYWGAHGANAVHFSVLQEYLAARIGVEVGRMFQVSNNYHGYTAVLPRSVPAVSRAYWAPQGRLAPLPMVTDPETFDDDLLRFMLEPLGDLTMCENTWFRRVAQPMWGANQARLDRDWQKYDTLVARVMASDWRAAAEMWRPT